MADFTSSLYLGLGHAASELQPWSRLTSGVPAALGVPARARRLAERLASVQGLEGATLAPSTLHVFWDLFAMPTARSWTLFVDGGAYAVARWGAERAAGRGTPVRRFTHYDPVSLRRSLSEAPDARRPVVVADGACAGCGRIAPLSDLVAGVDGRGGLVVLDDTQALGLLGRTPSAHAPYGTGGGGSARLHATGARRVVVVASMAKGFGVPMAALSGPRDLVSAFEAEAESRVHCSPVSFADVAAAEHALDVNEWSGDARRARLAHLVMRFRAGIGAHRLETVGLFPVQGVAAEDDDPVELQQHLMARGHRTVLHRPACRDAVRTSVVIRAAHTPEQIDDVIDAITTARLA
jgi:8-amino-7-oxononanoate synthase